MKPNTLLAFIGGALVGAAFALLYAPDKGAVTRKKIRAMAEDEYNALKNKMHPGQDCKCGEDCDCSDGECNDPDCK